MPAVFFFRFHFFFVAPPLCPQPFEACKTAAALSWRASGVQCDRNQLPNEKRVSSSLACARARAGQLASWPSARRSRSGPRPRPPQGHSCSCSWCHMACACALALASCRAFTRTDRTHGCACFCCAAVVKILASTSGSRRCSSSTCTATSRNWHGPGPTASAAVTSRFFIATQAHTRPRSPRGRLLAGGRGRVSLASLTQWQDDHRHTIIVDIMRNKIGVDSLLRNNATINKLLHC